MAESQIGAPASDEDIFLKKGANLIVWKWFGNKRSEIQPTTLWENENTATCFTTFETTFEYEWTIKALIIYW